MADFVRAELDALLAYAEAKGVKLHEFVWAERSEAEGYGFSAARPLGAFEPVLTLPLDSTLSLERSARGGSWFPNHTGATRARATVAMRVVPARPGSVPCS